MYGREHGGRPWTKTARAPAASVTIVAMTGSNKAAAVALLHRRPLTATMSFFRTPPLLYRGRPRRQPSVTIERAGPVTRAKTRKLVRQGSGSTVEASDGSTNDRSPTKVRRNAGDRGALGPASGSKRRRLSPPSSTPRQ
jgi:hypothetical protein